MGLHPSVRDLLEAQRGVVATWQLADAGLERGVIRHATGQLRCVRRGVYLSGDAPPTDWQRWRAATLSSRGTVLGVWSAACHAGLRQSDREPTTVQRLGDAGPQTFPAGPHGFGALRVHYVSRLGTDVVERDGIPMTRVSRTVLELLARQRAERSRARTVRDALRLNLVTPTDLRAQAALQHGERGAARLRQLVDLYGPLPLGRTRSDAEALALGLLSAAGYAMPELNVDVAGSEADLVRRDLGLIVELDGPQFHRFVAEDARKQAAWERAGFVVRRLPTDDVYDRPHVLFAAYADPITPAERATAAATRSAADVVPRLQAARAARDAG